MLENKKPSMPVLIEDLGIMPISEGSKYRRRFGLYRCYCGVEFKSNTANFKSGNTNSCGCYKINRIKETKTTHGLRKHPIYGVWSGIIKRITNPNCQAFKNYGGRGIEICIEWRNDFKAFYDFAMANGWKKGLEIDRIDNDKSYSPDNCRFVSKNINERNTRRIRSTNSSGYRGVSWHKVSSKWRARVMVDGVNKYLGLFLTAPEAAGAYDKYVIENGLEHTTNQLANTHSAPSEIKFKTSFSYSSV